MARQIVEGLRFIHTNQFVHRDLATKYIFVGASQDEKEIKIEDFGISEQFKFECESNLINLSFYCSKLIVYFLLIFFWQRYFVRKVKKFKLTLKETKVKRLLREKDPSMQKQIYTVCELLCSCCCTLTISGTERK
jgi:serine/threonine protein kinase